MFQGRVLMRRLLCADVTLYENIQFSSTPWKVQQRCMSRESLSEAYVRTKQKCECKYIDTKYTLINDAIGRVPMLLLGSEGHISYALAYRLKFKLSPNSHDRNKNKIKDQVLQSFETSNAI
jgi:hypothetical protein